MRFFAPFAHRRDLTTGYDSTMEDMKSKLPMDKQTQFVTFTMENGGVVSLRTSGTEPKLKFYVEVSGRTEHEGEMACEVLVEGVMKELIRVEEFGSKLEMPQ